MAACGRVPLEHAARQLLQLGVNAELRQHEAAELVRILIGERGELGARRAALVGREPREDARDPGLPSSRPTRGRGQNRQHDRRGSRLFREILCEIIRQAVALIRGQGNHRAEKDAQHG